MDESNGSCCAPGRAAFAPATPEHDDAATAVAETEPVPESGTAR